MKIGNIISHETVTINKHFNIFKKYDEVKNELPTLIIGLENIKQSGKDFKFTNRKINENLFWTFLKSERRTLFEEDLFYFVEYCYKRLIFENEYVFIDLILSSKDFLKNFFIDLESKKDINISFVSDFMIYILSKNKIYGVNLNQIDFIGGDRKLFIHNIKLWSNVFLTHEDIFIKYKNKLSMFNDEIKYIPLLYLIDKNE